MTQRELQKKKESDMRHARSKTTVVSDATFFDHLKDIDADYSLSYPCPYLIEKKGMIYKVKALMPRSPPLFFNPCLTRGDVLNVNLQFYVGDVIIGLMRCACVGDCPLYGDIAEPRSKLTPRRVMDDKDLRAKLRCILCTFCKCTVCHIL